MIDDAPVSRFHRKLLIACCGEPFLDGYVLSLIGLAIVGFAEEIPTSATAQGLIGAASLIGFFFGATVFGALTDKIGREKVYALDLTVLVAAKQNAGPVVHQRERNVAKFLLFLPVNAPCGYTDRSGRRLHDYWSS